jgi:hypothetical protein
MNTIPRELIIEVWEHQCELGENEACSLMPPELPAKSPVTVQQIDADTWIVKRARPSKVRMVMLLPDVKKLPRDADWQKEESRIIAHTSKNVAPFEE